MSFSFVEDQPTTETQDNEPSFSFVEEPTYEKEKYKDKVSENLRSQGVEPDITEEFERMYEYGDKQSALGLLSGATFGISKLVPGLNPDDNIASKGSEVIGSLIPISRLASFVTKPLLFMAAKSPILQGQISALARLTGTATTGAIVGGLDEATAEGKFKAPSVENMLEHGATWGAIDIFLSSLGWTGRFAKSLFTKAEAVGKTTTEVLEETLAKAKASGVNIEQEGKVAEKALSILEDKPLSEIQKEIKLSQKEAPGKTEQLAKERFEKQVNTRTSDLRSKKVDQQVFNKLEQNMSVQVKPYLPAEFEAEKIAEEAINEDLTQKIDEVAQRAATEKQLGENIQKDLEAQIKASKTETDALYDIAKEGQEGKYPKHKKTADSIVEQLKAIESEGISLTPEGYNKAKNDLMKALEDLGYSIVQDEQGLIKKAVMHTRVPLSRSIEVKKRLNNIINYDLLETSAQDFLKKPTAFLREDIRSGYGKSTKARKAFEEAESKFGEAAEKKGKKSITGIRKSEKPETIAKQIRTPSGLQDIKEVASPEQFAQIERELLEHMNGLSEERARAFYREMRPQLTPNTRSVAEQIIESKAPKGSPSAKAQQRDKIQQMVLDDISKSTITGERPDKALNLWKTEEGQQLIKHSLEGNPNKQEVLKYLSEQSLNDFASSVVSADGTINFKIFNKLLKDKATLSNLRLVAGEEGAAFFNNLEALSKRATKNFEIIEGKIDKGSAEARAELKKALEAKGEERLAKFSQKSKELTKEEALFKEKFGKEAQKQAKETKESLEIKGEERFKNIKEKNLQKEKDTLSYKFDDFLSEYGIKTKGLLALLGFAKFGIPGVLEVGTAITIFNKLSKSKKIQNAIKKAASPTSNPMVLFKAFDTIEEEMGE